MDSNEDSVDRISKLPNEVLAHILSYLETKEAVATSILSKRWEHLWTLTSVLDIDDLPLFDYEKENENNCISKCGSFKDYVDRVIFHHSVSNLKKCVLNLRSKCVAPNILPWISSVITSPVQELCVRYYHLSHETESITFPQLPSRLFTCKTLVVLGIYGCFVLDILTHVCFPCLKIFRTKCSIFVDDASAERLFSSCPVLEELSIYRADYCLKIMNISSHSLKILSFSSWKPSTQIVINAPRLEYLEILGHWPNEYRVNFPNSISGACLGDGYDASLLNGISQVEHLVLRGNSKSLCKIISESGFPKLKNLVGMRYLTGTPVNWMMLLNLLHCCPNLEVLYVELEEIHTVTSANRNVNQMNWQQPESVPECVRLHLKKIEILGFEGLKEGLHVVEYLLKSSQALDKMIIEPDYLEENLTAEKKMKRDEVVSQVLSFERSNTCEVIFRE